MVNVSFHSFIHDTRLLQIRYKHGIYLQFQHIYFLQSVVSGGFGKTCLTWGALMMSVVIDGKAFVYNLWSTYAISGITLYNSTCVKISDWKLHNIAPLREQITTTQAGDWNNKDISKSLTWALTQRSYRLPYNLSPLQSPVFTNML